MIFALVWGTIRIFVSAYNSSAEDASELAEVIEAQKQWGFAQVVAITLLALPMISFFGMSSTAHFLRFRLIHDIEALCADPKIIPKRRQAQSDTFVVDPPGELPIHMQSESKSSWDDSSVKIHGSDSMSNIRAELRAKAWYKMLIVIWYAYSALIGADMLFVFPGLGGTVLLSYGTSVGEIIIGYGIWMAIDFGLMWIATLIFLDADLNRWWTSTRVGRFLSKPRASYVGWASVIIVVVGASATYDGLQNDGVFSINLWGPGS